MIKVQSMEKIVHFRLLYKARYQRIREVIYSIVERFIYLPIILLAFLALPVPALYAQSQKLDLIRYQWSSKDGLPDWNIHCFMQDRNGLMWMVSASGLFTFDGITFRMVSSVNARKNPARIIRMAEDIHGNIWLIRFLNDFITIEVLDPKTGGIQPLHQYVEHPDPIRLPISHTLNLYNIQGQIWIGSENVGYQYDGTWKKVFTNNRSDTKIWFPAPKGKFWLLGSNQIYLSDSRGTALDSFSTPGQVLRWSWLDTDRSLWTAYSAPEALPIGHYHQLIPRANAITALYTKSPPATSWINDQNLDAREQKLIGHGLMLTRNANELYLGTAQAPIMFNLSQLHPDAESMMAFYFDQTGGLWSCSTQGISRFILRPQLPFRTLLQDLSPKHSMRGIARMGKALYALSYSGTKSIDLSDTKDIRSIRYPGDSQGYALYNDAQTLWIGTDQLGLRTIQPNGKQQIFDLASIQAVAFCMHRNTRMGLLIGTNKGIFRLRPGSQLFEKTTFQGHEVYTMYENKSGVWVGTSNGVYLLDADFHVLRHALEPRKRLNYERPIHFYEHAPGQFWIATRGAGLIHWNSDTDAIRQFNTETGLSNNNVHAVYPDDNGYLWLPSDYGLMRFKPADGSVQTFLKTDGLADNEFNFLSHFKDEDGTLYFGGINGITYFHPNDIPVTADFTQSLQLIEAKSFKLKDGTYSYQTANGKSIQPLEISPEDGYLDVHFSPLLFDGNNRIRIAWKIEGVQKQWVQQESPVIRLSNLPYGKQQLLIRFSTQSSVWSPTQVFPISVVRPFYLRWPFLLLIGVLLVGSALGFARWRNRRLYAANIRLEDEVEKRTLEIKNNLAIIEEDKQTILHQTQELRALDEMKSRFFTNITHELRTPLTLILGPLDRLIHHRATPETTPELLETIRRNALKLQNLVEELLDLSKMEVNKLILDEKPILLHTFFTHILSSFMLFAKHRGIALQTHFRCPDSFTIFADAKKLEKIIGNLVGNALKFTPSGGTISVSVHCNEHTLTIQVKDNGNGIPPEDLPYIFDRYFQSKSLRASIQGGTGIGLALAREYARLFGGSLDAESTFGKGSTFTLAFPYTQLPTHQHPVPSIPDTGYLPEKRVEVNASHPLKHTLLLVEDDEDMLSYIRALLLPEYNIVFADNGKTALAQLERHTVDLVLSDVMMPEMDGFELLATVKETYPDLPFILLTARIETPDRLQALRLGVDDYLTKPFQEEELLARLQNLIQRYEIRRALRLEHTMMAETEHTEVHPTESLESYDQKWMRQLEAIAQQHLQNPDFSIQRLAEAMRVSERTLQYKIKAHTGLTPNQYVVEARLQKARQLLEAKTYPTISEVCYAVGFKTTQYFARIMKERFGKSPSEF